MKSWSLIAAILGCCGAALLFACAGNNDLHTMTHYYVNEGKSSEPNLENCPKCDCNSDNCPLIGFTSCPDTWDSVLENNTCNGDWRAGSGSAVYIQACAALNGAVCSCITQAQLATLLNCQ
jgi:hypothetical protein